MRGCDNMSSFCVVHFTRGRERSRETYSIVQECKDLFDNGYREVTLLGQNVDSYKWAKAQQEGEAEEPAEKVNFAGLLEMVALIHPDLRIRFSTSHPKDITDEVLYLFVLFVFFCFFFLLLVLSGFCRVLVLL